MAINMHFVNTGFFTTDTNGNILNKDTASLKQMATANNDHLVIPSDSVPNSANHPSVSAYLAAEADSDFVVHYMDQYTIITYERTSDGGFA